MSQPEALTIFERDTTITPSKLRSIGYIPATIYGKHVTPRNIQVKAHGFELALARGVREFHLEGFGEPTTVQVKQLQKNDAKGVVLHIEFLVPSGEGDSKAAKKQAQRDADRAERAAKVDDKQPVAAG